MEKKKKYKVQKNKQVPLKFFMRCRNCGCVYGYKESTPVGGIEISRCPMCDYPQEHQGITDIEKVDL